MARNLELKIKTGSHSDLISKIEKNGIKLVGLLNQKDIYYKYDKGILKLRIQNGNYQLIKYNRNENKGERWSDYSILTINGDNVEDYLNDFFDAEIIVEKERKLYLLKNTRIHLDNVKDLGYFIELETVVGKTTENDCVTEFEEVIELLKLNKENEIRKSYKDLFIEQRN